MKLILIPLILMGCAASSVKVSEAPTGNVHEWTSVKLIDLPGKPVITKGDSSDGLSTFVTIKKENAVRYFRIDRKEQTLTSVSAFEFRNSSVREMKSFARETQMKIMYDHYLNVWRCRYSEGWNQTAGRDLREQGALLLDIQAFNPILQSFRLLIGIDSATFEVTGLSGVTGVESMDEPYYTSSVNGMNHLFGLVSSSTMMNRNFGYACQEAYFRRLPDYRRSLDSYEACTISPSEEPSLSKTAEIFARLEKMSLVGTSLAEYTAQDFDRQPFRKYNPPFEMLKIETLIKTARSGHGVGL